jgi:hypothetical protein
MTDLRAQIEALPWRVWQPQDEPLADAEREWGDGLEWAVSEYRDAVLARIPPGSVLVTRETLAAAMKNTRSHAVSMTDYRDGTFVECLDAAAIRAALGITEPTDD